jgi:hypothetical protein
VEVALEEVLLRKVIFWKVEEPVTRALPKVPKREVTKFPPTLREPVLVALVVVALIPVKFCKVEEPFAWRLEAVTWPEEVTLPAVMVALN